MASTVHTNYPGVCLFTQNSFCCMRHITPCLQAIFWQIHIHMATLLTSSLSPLRCRIPWCVKNKARRCWQHCKRRWNTWYKAFTRCFNGIHKQDKRFEKIPNGPLWSATASQGFNFVTGVILVFLPVLLQPGLNCFPLLAGAKLFSS